MLDGVPLLLAFTGGLVATVNPCGFAMLPAYLSFFVGLESDAPHTPSVATRRALQVGAIVASGFVVVFATAGVLLAAGAHALTTALPWAAMLIGVTVAGLGVWLLAGRQLPLRLPAPTRATSGRSTSAVFGFGVAYGVASLSCTLPVFLAVVVGTLTRSSLVDAAAVFVVYAVGMALPLLAVSVALALGKETVIPRARALTRYTTRVAGVLLLLSGGYVVAFWAVTLSGGSVPGLVTAVEGLSSRVTTLIGSRPLLWGTGLTLVVAVSALLAYKAGSGARHDEAPASSASSAAVEARSASSDPEPQ